MRRLALLALVLLGGLPVGLAGEEGGEPEPLSPERRDAALEKAFAYLDDHLFRLTDYGSSGKQFAAAVAGWAYLLAGERGGERLPSRTREIRRIRGYLGQYVKQVERLYEDGHRAPSPAGTGAPPGAVSMGFGPRQFCWNLGVAGLFFAESHARGKDKAGSKRVLRQLAAVVEAAQQPNGGWGHDDARIPGFGVPEIPIPTPGGGTRQLSYPHTLVAATNCAAAALGAAHRVLGPKTQPEAVRKAVAYYREAQNPPGTFPYDPSQKHPSRLPPGAVIPSAMLTIERARTAGSVFALHALGVPEGDEMIERALQSLDEAPGDASEGHGSATMALLFGALVGRLRGPEAWAVFRSTFFPRILAAQDEEGAFACVCRGSSPGVTCDTSPPGGLGALEGYLEGKKVYVTAIHSLVLLLDRAVPRALPPLPAPGPTTPR